MSNIFLDRPKYFEIASRCAHYPVGDMKLFLTPIESTSDYCGTILARNRTKLSRSHSSMGSNTGRVEMYRWWPRDEVKLARWIVPAMSTMVQAILDSTG